ncbi:H-NS histone family protein [Burkholderia pyrrocinia]|uniref:H-NS histone family protein n=1 Tax=Burkholderia pyrrocinia TaxID=60550 RepID=UPI00157504DF|nr:H-NS histone family protein [Burkholderia pyrrocinia]NTX25707.1 H-NS histone family protein [Burkholderia pyrrocinia]
MSTYRELLIQLDILKKEIDAARDREAHLIAERVMELLAENGVPIRDVLAQHHGDRRLRSPVKPKYWNPKTGVTWSGRGRMPRWLVGQDLERFRITSPDEASRQKDDSGRGAES